MERRSLDFYLENPALPFNTAAYRGRTLEMRLMSYQVCQIPLLYFHHYEYNENWLTKLHPLWIRKRKNYTTKKEIFFFTIIRVSPLASLHGEHGWIFCFSNSERAFGQGSVPVSACHMGERTIILFLPPCPAAVGSKTLAFFIILMQSNGSRIQKYLWVREKQYERSIQFQSY